jgi:hypothetical protein
VLGGRRERHRERLSEFADRPFALGEFPKHAPARGIAKGVKDGIELRYLFNHVVEYTPTTLKVNRSVKYF